MLHKLKTYSTFLNVFVVAMTLSYPCYGFWREDIQDGAPKVQIDFSKIPNAIPKVETLSKLGNPLFYDVEGHRYYVSKSSHGFHKEGYASWYGTKFHGRKTSSGEPYNMFAMTAAHRTLPIPCYVRVTNFENGKQIIVKVNDRGPFHDDRIIDLSYAAANKLDILKNGTAYVQVDAIDPQRYNEQQGFTHKQNKRNTPNRPYSQKHLIYLQVGAFEQRFQAKQFARKIKPLLTERVNIYEVKLSQRSIYRIKIGPLLDHIEGLAINQRLKDAGLTGGMLTTS